ncbi:hypothetical protein Tco_0507537 [Tanacetum coccineum]
MAETMEQYMSKTRADYGSGITRPKIEDKDSFKLKGQFLKELRDNTFSGSDHEDANEHIEKVLEITDLFHIHNITIDQVMFRAFPMSLTGAEVVLFYNGLDVLTRQILDSRGAIPSKSAVDTKVAIQEMAKYSQKWHNGTSRTRSTEASDRLVAIQAQLNNLGREIKKVNEKVYAAQVGCEQYFIILDMPEDIKVPLILGRLFLSITHAKIDVFKRKITLRAGEEKIFFKSVKPAISLIKRVYMLSLRERMKLDLEARLIGETLVLNRSLDPLFEDYIIMIYGRFRKGLNIWKYSGLDRHWWCLEVFLARSKTSLTSDLFASRRDQVDDLMPTIKEGEIVEEFRARNDARMDLAAKKSTTLVKYQSSGILCAIVVMLAYRRIYNTHPCS